MVRIELNLVDVRNQSLVKETLQMRHLEIACSDVYPMSCYNNTQNLGYILKAFIELFELDEEDGLRITKIKNIPCRLIFESKNGCIWGSRCIGIGHFMKDKFVFIEDFAKINE